ncbi:hypothetical protein [uncultured Psychroserpens sp.]|uniref:hypothetical protein n=1 Tax=uncultured Psychroserpens sp. TaxID=255436 RepID=UPI002635106A|nr:hypothetical protein [uncultured Psychroserpens sp.]
MSFFIVNVFDQGHWNNYEPISIEGFLIMLSVAAFFLIIHKVVNRKPSKISMDNELNLESYTLDFNNNQVTSKKVSVLTKIGVYIISVLILITPLSSLLQLTYSYNYYGVWRSWILW